MSGTMLVLVNERTFRDLFGDELMTDKLVDEMEQYLGVLVEAVGGYYVAVDAVGDSVERRYEFRAVVFGRNCSVQRIVDPCSVDWRKEVEAVVRSMAETAMERAFERAYDAAEAAQFAAQLEYAKVTGIAVSGDESCPRGGDKS